MDKYQVKQNHKIKSHTDNCFMYLRKLTRLLRTHTDVTRKVTEVVCSLCKVSEIKMDLSFDEKLSSFEMSRCRVTFVFTLTKI